MDKFYLIANPVSGNGKAGKDWHKIAALLTAKGVDYREVFTTEARQEQQLVARAIEQGYRKFIVLGGDGTLNETINGIFNQDTVAPNKITVGVIPVGTGNDWCRMFHIPNNYEKAIEIIKTGNIFLHDAGVIAFAENDMVRRHFFIIMAGFGYDGFVGTKMNEERKDTRGGRLAYYMGILKNLFKYTAVDMNFAMDEKNVSGSTLTACVAITKYNGGGMMQAPFAVADDGLLDVTIISGMSKPEMILNMPHLMNGSFVKNKKVQTFKTTRVEISATPFSYIEADGETVGKTPAVISILPQAVKMIVA